jgi:pimeloyl-ACP methyl ester carboxylesterase
MPTLIMTGENEIGSTPEMTEMLAKQIHNSKIYIIPKAKHMATFEKSDLVNIEISKFIS